MTTTIVTPDSEKHVLAAATAKIVAGGSGPITVHIPTGTTADIYTTLGTNEEINDSTADWVEWPGGVRAGPYRDTIVHPVTGIKMLSVAGGDVYIKRG